jgi:hypothetical protein
MLNRLTFKNYRAFPEGEFRIRPVTILVGANSVGKTSLLQLPLILKQTAFVGSKPYKAALKIHGREVNIGDPKNFFFNQNIQEPFSISIAFSSTRLMDDLKTRLFAEFSDLIVQTVSYFHYILSQQSNTPKPSAKFFKDFRTPSVKEPYNDNELQMLLDFLTSTSDLVAKVSEKTRPGQRLAFPFGQLGGRLIEGTPTLFATDVERTYRFLNTVSSKIGSSEFAYNADISLHEFKDGKYLRIDKISLFHDKRALLDISIKDNVIDKISSQFVDDKIVDNYQRTMDKCINHQSTLFNFFQQTKLTDTRFHLPELFRTILCSAQQITEAYFDDDTLGHIGPLR